MAFDPELAERIRGVLSPRDDVHEKKMFGGIAFMVRGHMTVGINGNELMAKVGKAAYEDCLSLPHAREMDFTGRALKGFIYVSADGTAADCNEGPGLEGWIRRCLDWAESMPAK